MTAPASIDLDRLAAARRTLLKDEPGARVELLGETDAVVRKTYFNRGLRLLQTLWRRSRAEREFANLAAVAAAGIACTPPLAWSAQRRLGCVPSSTLVTGFVAATATLKAVLATVPRSEATTRRRLATALGQLLAALHARGILWTTPMPRNVLVQGPPAASRLLLCDAPAAVLFAGAVPAGAAQIDLFDGIASPSRRREWTATERLRCLLAYCAGDRNRARDLWRRLARRSRLGHRLRKNLLMGLRTYILARPMRDARGTVVR